MLTIISRYFLHFNYEEFFRTLCLMCAWSYVPSFSPTPAEQREGTEVIDVYGRMVPAPPKLAPPPIPSPSNRRPSISSAKYVSETVYNH